jgi:hypothetical protein
MFTARAFWTIKMITTISATAPVIRPVRMPLIRVRAGRPGAAWGASGGGGAEPLGEGGGILVVPCGAGDAVMTRLLPGGAGAAETLAGSVADPGLPDSLRLLLPVSCLQITLEK